MPDELVFTKSEIERFKALTEVFKNDPSGSVQTTQNLHGLSPQNNTLGLFGAPGVDPRMFSTVVRANGSFIRALRKYPTRILKERVEIVAGIGAGSGTNPSNFCGDGMRPGAMTVCQQNFEFGEVKASTNVVEGAKIGGRYDRADQDRRVIPDPGENGPFTPDPVLQARNQNSITWKQMNELAAPLNRAHEVVLIQGNKAASNVGAGSQPYFIRQPDGLDRWIKEGYTDARSGDDCEALNSRVRNFGGNLTGTNADGATIVDEVTDMVTGIEMDVNDMGYSVDMAAWAFVMHPRMWRPLTRMWPCAYQTMGCDTLADDSGQRLIVDGERQRAFQDQMYTGKYLLVDGIRIPVLFSWGVPIVNVGPDQWNGSLYYVPLVLQGEDVTYVEYFNMGNAEQEEWYNLTGPNNETRVTNNGLYRMHRYQKGGCLEYDFVSMWRLMFKAPFAAGRIDNINFYDRTRMRSPMPGESYYAAGGVSGQGPGYN